jgi:ankyrin repeat protein
VFCQLETLRHCLPPSVRHTLDELPESLDETYECVLKEIKKPNRGHVRRLLQCLVAAIWPLDMKELAEVLAVDFDDAEGVPKLKPNWCWEDEEQALLTSCSSLITIVKTEDLRVVQFSHFSVKEFLTSERLATSSGDISRYHIVLEPAHTILAQACMSVLLQSDDHVEENGIRKRSPLALYAARYWVIHAQFGRVSSFLRKTMEYLFDVDKPNFAAWLRLHNIDTYVTQQSSSLYWFVVSTDSGITPLYCAALCGFEDLVEHLVVKYPQGVNTSGGRYVTPLVAALGGRHFQTAKILRHNGAYVNVHGLCGHTPLHSVAWYGDLEMVRILLDYKADVNVLGLNDLTPIHYASSRFLCEATPHNIRQLFPDVTRLLLEHGADINARTNGGMTPLHLAASGGWVEVVRMLLEHGANVGAEDNGGKTPLHSAVDYDNVEVVRMLLERGANVGAKDVKGMTPFQIASAEGFEETMKLLSEHGAKGVL